MSELSPLTELARFVGASPLAHEDPAVRQNALDRLTQAIDPQPSRRKVSDLLSVVMVVSARARRMIRPRALIEMDVFSPGGRRAVRLLKGEPSRTSP